MAEDIRIPNRFESLHEVFGDQIRPLIVPIPDDLRTFTGLRDRARIQNGGLLSFLLGSTGMTKRIRPQTPSAPSQCRR